LCKAFALQQGLNNVLFCQLRRISVVSVSDVVLVLGTLSVEAIYQDRDQFAQLVREVAAPDVGRMGIEILSFTIKDVYDSVEYLESLGRAQTANVKRDADIGVAEANRDAGIRVCEICIALHHSRLTVTMFVW